MHFFLPFLSLVSLSFAAPRLTAIRLDSGQMCYTTNHTLEWQVSGFATFIATPKPHPTNVSTSFISFKFIDTSRNTSSKCGRSTVPGTDNSMIDDSEWYPCADPSFRYKYDGQTLGLEERLLCLK